MRQQREVGDGGGMDERAEARVQRRLELVREEGVGDAAAGKKTKGER